MPTTQYGSSSTKVDVFNVDSKGYYTYSFSFNATHPARRTRVFDATVQRPRPLDLFMSGTSRSTQTDLYSRTYYSWRTTNPGESGQMYQDYPLWAMYQVSSTRVDGNGSAISDPVSSISRAALYNAIRNELRGQDVNLANCLGEYKQTAQLFLDLAKVVSSRGRSLIRRHNGIYNPRRGRIDLPSTAANAELQFQYGIRPLAQDMGTAIAELQSSVIAKPPYIEGRMRRKDRGTNVGYRQPNSTIYTRWAQSELTIERRIATRYRAYFSSNPLIATLASHGMLNPASLAWELTPYSFVVDWWFNVGDILSSMDNLLIYDSLWVIDSTSTRRFEYLTPLSRPNNLSNPTGFYAGRTDF